MLHFLRRSSPQIELLTTPSTIFSRLIAEIQRARKSVDMEFYIFDNDHIGSTLLALLCRKVRQGVVVRLLVDGYGSRGLWRHRQRLRSEGIELHFHPLLANVRNHRKLVIIDSRAAYLGGVNIADRYVVGNSLGAWHDVQLHIQGRAVASLMALFDYDLVTARGGTATPPGHYLSHHISLYWSEGDGGRAMEHLFLSALATARQEVIMATPYFFPPHTIIEQMRATCSRGVRVRLLLPACSDSRAIDNLACDYIARAQSFGVEVLVCREGFVHAKMMMVDNRRLILGSANLDSRSLRTNRELMASSTEPHLCYRAKAFLQGVIARSTLPLDKELRCAIPGFIARMLCPIL